MGHGDMQASIRVTHALTLAVTHEYRARRAPPALVCIDAPARPPPAPLPPTMPVYIAGDSTVPFWPQYGHVDVERGDWVGPGLSDTRYEVRAAPVR